MYAVYNKKLDIGERNRPWRFKTPEGYPTDVYVYLSPPDASKKRERRQSELETFSSTQ